MINILDIIPEIKHLDSTYIDAMQLKLNEYLSYAEISSGLAHHNIDVTKLPRRLDILKTNISQIVDEGYCLAFNFLNYKNTGKLSALLIEQYFRNSILNDTTLNNILYIDTNLLMDDYKRLFNKDEHSNQYTHKLDTLYSSIECAPMVIWDKFTMTNTNYDKTKLYNILSIRYRKGLGNIYFCKDCVEQKNGSDINCIYKYVDVETNNVMNTDVIINCVTENLQFVDDGEDKLQW